MSEYPDTNGNGIPDAFENRKSIREILNPETVRLENAFENKDYVEADQDRAFAVYVPPQKGAVLLEVRYFCSPRSAACLFRSRDQFSEFIYALEAAATEAFKDQEQETLSHE